MDALDHYKRLTVRRMEDTADSEGGLSVEDLTKYTMRIEKLWSALSQEQRVAAETWVAEQKQYREANGIGPLDLTPGERQAVQFDGEYDLILAENDHDVVFQIAGRDVTISRGVLLDYDEEGRFCVAREDADELGLLPKA